MSSDAGSYDSRNQTSDPDNDTKRRSVDPADNDETDSSPSPNSTSTYQYSHEPYDTFQQKIIALAKSLGDFDNVEIQRLRGGSYNRVAGVSVTTGNKTVKCLFRIPRVFVMAEEDKDRGPPRPEINCEIHDQSAVLQFLASRAITAPRLLAFDATFANPIDSSYVVHEFASGTRLDLLYADMTLPEKLSVVDSVVKVLIAMERIQFTKTGILAATKQPAPPPKLCNIDDMQWNTLASEVQGFTANTDGDKGLCQSSTTTATFLFEQLDAYREGSRHLTDGGAKFRLYERVRRILSEIKEFGLFWFAMSASPSPSILYHWDLEPRNILVRKTDNLRGIHWEIDTIIDWDQPQVVPPVLTRRPPIWLWDFTDITENSSVPKDCGDDVDYLPPNRYDASSGRLSEDDRRIREHFETSFVQGLQEVYPGYNRDDYSEEAYGVGRVIRKVAYFAIEGFTDVREFDTFEALDKEWRQLRSAYSQSEHEDDK